MAKILGVDFSHWQANVDFAKLAANNVRFAIFKAGEIPTSSKKEYTDELYKRNIAEARQHNIISGAYYYFHPSMGASRQARHFDAVMQRDGQPDLPPVIDIEDTDQRDPVQVADVLKATLDALMARGYRRPIIYSRWGFLVNQVGEPYWLKQHYLWLAQYSTQLVYKPADMSNVIMWQYTDRLKLPGVGVALDGNYWLKTEEELLALVQKPPAAVEIPVQEEPEPVVIPEPETVQEEPQEFSEEIIPTQAATETLPMIEEIPVEIPQTEETSEPIPAIPLQPALQPDGEEPNTVDPGGVQPEFVPTVSGFWAILQRIIRAILKSFE